MQSVNPAVLEAAIRGLLLKRASLAGAGRYLSAFGEYVKSDKRSERFAWIGPPPRMERLGPDRETVYTPMSDAGYELENETFSAGIVIDEEDIEDDQLGAIMMQVRKLAQAGAHLPDRLVLEALINGATGLCYDGTPFFGETHPARGDAPEQSNIHTGSGDSTSQVMDDFADALAMMQELRDENGEPFHADDISKLVIVAGPRMRKPMKEAFGASEVAATSNVQVDGLDLKIMISSRVTGFDWRLLNVGGAVKPIIFQDRVALQLRSLEHNSKDGVERGQHKWKVRQRCTAGYAEWQNAILIDNV